MPFRAATCGILFILLTGMPLAAASADPRTESAQETLGFTVYTAREGLSDEVWTAIGFDAEGFVWAGSASELARFDGYRWTLHPQPGAARSLVRDLRAAPDGTLWAVFERDGLAVRDGSEWTLAGHADTPIQQLADWSRPDGTRTLAAPARGGRLVREAGSWQFEPALASITATDVETTEKLGGEQREWMAGGGLWFRPRDGRSDWQRYTHAGFVGMDITDLHRTESAGRESLWVLCYGGGVSRIDDRGVRTWRLADGLPSEAIYRARDTRSADGSTVLWMATRGGLVRLQDERLDVYDRRHGLPSDAVRSLEVQRDVDGVDLLWLATEGGVARAALGANPWRTVSTLGARYNGVFSVLHEDLPEGDRLWVSSAQDGLWVRERGRWRELTAPGGARILSLRQVWRLPRDDGSPWHLVSAAGLLLEADENLVLRPIAAPWTSLGDTGMHALARRVDDVLEYWFVTRTQGIHRLREGRWTPFAPADGRPMGIGFRLSEQIDDSGRSWLWAATERGLLRFDGTQWEAVPLDGLPDAGLRTATPIVEDGRTVLWLGATRHGTLRLDVHDPRAPRPLPSDAVPPPPDSTVYTILADAAGHIYVCTNNGVQRLMRDAKGRWRERVFRRRDGLVHDECNTNAQQIDAQGRYWVGTLAGLSLYDPRTEVLPRSTQVRPVRFTALHVDDALQVPDPVAGTVVAPDVRQLRIDYTLLSGQRETETRYRVRLEGLDAAFGPWTDERSHSYSRLPPGRYRLHVEARDYAGTVGRADPLPIVVEPQWHERAIVRAAALLLLALLAVSAVRGWNRNLRRQQRMLTDTVAQRTRELSTANEQLRALSYVDALTGVANRRRFDEALAEAFTAASAVRRALGLVVIDVDHFKAYNDRYGHPVGDMALRTIADTLRACVPPGGLLARHGGEEFVVLLPQATPEGIAALAETLRTAVAALPPAALGNPDHGLTLSAGTVLRIPAAGDSPDTLLGEADAALYRAKQDGRNCVRMGRAAPRTS